MSNKSSKTTGIKIDLTKGGTVSDITFDRCVVRGADTSVDIVGGKGKLDGLRFIDLEIDAPLPAEQKKKFVDTGIGRVVIGLIILAIAALVKFSISF